MPSALVAALAAPIREVQSLVGPGWTGDPVDRSGGGARPGARRPGERVGGHPPHLGPDELDRQRRRCRCRLHGVDGRGHRWARCTSRSAEHRGGRRVGRGRASPRAVGRDRRPLRGTRAGAGAVPGLTRCRRTVDVRGTAIARRGGRRRRGTPGRVGRAHHGPGHPDAARSTRRLRLRAWHHPGCLRWARVWPAVPHR